MDRNAKILLIAKPWHGGLARYVFASLCQMFPGRVEWLQTYPSTTRDFLAYRRNRDWWRFKVAQDIVRQDYTLALFIGLFDAFVDTSRRERNVLWLIDGPQLTREQLMPYGRVFLSDTGYESDLLKVIEHDRYGGELAFAMDPGVHQAQEKKSKLKSICFIGNRDAARDAYISALFDAGLRPTIVGNYFMRHRLYWRHPQCFRPKVANDDMGRIYARHRIALNIHARVVRKGTNMRTFECAGYQIPMIVDHRVGLDRYFEPEKEILVFSNTEEMQWQIGKLLHNTQLSSTMAENAKKRALAEHTYFHRLNHLFETIQ